MMPFGQKPRQSWLRECEPPTEGVLGGWRQMEGTTSADLSVFTIHMGKHGFSSRKKRGVTLLNAPMDQGAKDVRDDQPHREQGMECFLGELGLLMGCEESVCWGVRNTQVIVNKVSRHHQKSE